MHITYQPEDAKDGEHQVWDFDPSRVRAGEAELIERRFGGHYDQWRDGVRSGNVKARRILLWHLMRKQHHTLRLEDVPDFYMSELLVEHSVTELIELLNRMEKSTMDETTREQIRVGLDLEIKDAMMREGIETLPEAAPKAE